MTIIFSNKLPNSFEAYSIEVGFNKILITHNTPIDEDLTGIVGWIKETGTPNNTATQVEFNYSGGDVIEFGSLDKDTSYDLSVAFVDSIASADPTVLAAQYYNTNSLLDITSYSPITTLDAVTIVSVDRGSPTDSPGSMVSMDFTLASIPGVSSIVIEAQESPGTDWKPIYTGVTANVLPVSVKAGTYNFRVTSYKNLSNGTTDSFAPQVYGSSVIITEHEVVDTPGANNFTLELRDGVFPSDTVANADFLAEFGRDPVIHDHLTYVNADNTVSEIKRFDGTNWVAPTMVIPGDLLTKGTVTADYVVASIAMEAPTITGGLFKTAVGTGNRVEIGSTDTYRMWYGTGAKNDANAIMYLKSDGSAYFKGTLELGDGTTIADAGDIEGQDGIDAINSLPAPIYPAYLGGSSDIIFTLNQLPGGATNLGELRIQGTEFFHPDGTKRTFASDLSVYTPYGDDAGGSAGKFYLVWTDTISTTRFPTLVTNNTNFIAVIYESNIWKVIDNSANRETITFTPTDCFLAVVEAETSNGGLSKIVPFISAKGINGLSAYEIWLQTNSGTEADFLESLNGTDGIDGNIWHSVTSGVPSGSLGEINDFALSAGRYVYKKTGASTWTYVEDLQGPAGAAGSNGVGFYTIESNGGVFPSNTQATADFLATTGRLPEVGDHFTYRNADNTVSSIKRYSVTGSPGTWSAPALVINGDLLTKGTVTAAELDVDSVFAESITATGSILYDATGGTFTRLGGGSLLEASVNNVTALLVSSDGTVEFDGGGIREGSIGLGAINAEEIYRILSFAGSDAVGGTGGITTKSISLPSSGSTATITADAAITHGSNPIQGSVVAYMNYFKVGGSNPGNSTITATLQRKLNSGSFVTVAGPTLFTGVPSADAEGNWRTRLVVDLSHVPDNPTSGDYTYRVTFSATSGPWTTLNGTLKIEEEATGNVGNEYNHPSYTARDTGTLTGATVVSRIQSDSIGSVTNIATRTLTLENLGYTGDTDANKYILPAATASVRGGIKIGSNLVLASDVLSGYGAGTDISVSSNNFNVVSSTSASNNTIVKRNSSGRIFANRYQMTDPITASTISGVFYETGSNGYIERCTLAHFKSQFGKANDSELLDGLNSTQFLRSDQNDELSGTLRVNTNSTAAVAVVRSINNEYVGYTWAENYGSYTTRWLQYMENNAAGKLFIQGRDTTGANPKVVASFNYDTRRLELYDVPTINGVAVAQRNVDNIFTVDQTFEGDVDVKGYIKYRGVSNFYIDNAVNGKEIYIRGTTDGGSLHTLFGGYLTSASWVGLRYNNADVFRTLTDGTRSGVDTDTNYVEVRHNASNGYVGSTVGHLYLRALEESGNVYLQTTNADSSTDFPVRAISGATESQAELYYGASRKFRTLTSGVEALGNLYFSGDYSRYISRNFNYFRWVTPNGYVDIGANDTTSLRFNTDRSQFLFDQPILTSDTHIGISGYKSELNRNDLFVGPTTYYARLKYSGINFLNSGYANNPNETEVLRTSYTTATGDYVAVSSHGNTSISARMLAGKNVFAVGTHTNNLTAVNNLVNPLETTWMSVTSGIMYLSGKEFVNFGDNWLRINETKADGFTSGVYFGDSIVRSDFELQVGSNGSSFRATTSAITLGEQTTSTNKLLIPNSSSMGINTSDGYAALTSLSDTLYIGDVSKHHRITLRAQGSDDFKVYYGGTNYDIFHAGSPSILTEAIYSKGNQMVISAGDIGPTVTSNVGTTEILHLAGENGVKVYSAPNNDYNFPSYHQATLIDAGGNSTFNNVYTGTLYPTTIVGRNNLGVIDGTTNVGTSVWFTSGILSDTWVRVRGNNGIYFQAHGGGFNMQDTTWVRVYGSKKFYVSNTTSESIKTAGGIDVAGTSQAAEHLSTSDIRVKKDILPIDDALNKVCQLRGVNFTHMELDKYTAGHIAQEVEEIMPEVVSTKDTDELKNKKSLSSAAILGYHTEAIKELKNLVDELRAEISALKGE